MPPFITKKVEAWRLHWGLAPEGTPKYKAGKKAEEFLIASLAEHSQVIRGKLKEIPRVAKTTRIGMYNPIPKDEYYIKADDLDAVLSLEELKETKHE